MQNFQNNAKFALIEKSLYKLPSPSNPHINEKFVFSFSDKEIFSLSPFGREFTWEFPTWLREIINKKLAD